MWVGSYGDCWGDPHPGLGPHGFLRHLGLKREPHLCRCLPSGLSLLTPNIKCSALWPTSVTKPEDTPPPANAAVRIVSLPEPPSGRAHRAITSRRNGDFTPSGPLIKGEFKWNPSHCTPPTSPQKQGASQSLRLSIVTIGYKFPSFICPYLHINPPILLNSEWACEVRAHTLFIFVPSFPSSS